LIEFVNKMEKIRKHKKIKRIEEKIRKDNEMKRNERKE
jgi:hypothetical protein